MYSSFFSTFFIAVPVVTVIGVATETEGHRFIVCSVSVVLSSPSNPNEGNSAYQRHDASTYIDESSHVQNGIAENHYLVE